MKRKKLYNNKKKVANSIQKVSNGIGGAIGYQGNITNWNYSNGGYQNTSELSQTDTLYKNNRWYLISNMRQLLSEIFLEHGLIQTLVSVPVDDGMRGGITVSSKQLDENEIKKLQISIKRDGDLTVAGDANKWTRLYGGGAIVIMTDQDPESPFDINAIDSNTPVEFRAIDMWELTGDGAQDSSFDPDIQEEEFDYFLFYGVKLHKSRVMIMKGLTAPSFVRPRLRGWGFSIIEHVVRSLNQYLKSNNLSFEILDEFKIDVFKIDGLTETLLTEEGQNLVKQRIQMVQWAKNFQHSIVMDKNDDFASKQLSFGGLAEVMREIKSQIASDLRMPELKVWGRSAGGGLNSSSEDEIEVYNCMVESEVRSKVEFEILRMLEIKCQKLFGFVPDDLEITFKPLRNLSALDEENVKTQKFARLMQAKSAGEITTFEFRESCNKDKLLAIELDTSEDKLNPHDPEIQSVLAPDNEDEVSSEGNPSSDVNDSGTKSFDMKKPRRQDIQINSKRIKNSPAFERASYELDGGENWLVPGRINLLQELYKDPYIWAKAVEQSEKAYGELNESFALWYYKKLGGKL